MVLPRIGIGKINCQHIGILDGHWPWPWTAMAGRPRPAMVGHCRQGTAMAGQGQPMGRPKVAGAATISQLNLVLHFLFRWLAMAGQGLFLTKADRICFFVFACFYRKNIIPGVKRRSPLLFRSGGGVRVGGSSADVAEFTLSTMAWFKL